MQGIVLIRIKTGKMLTDDLLRGIALDALSANVPACDDTLRVQHEDGVILYAVHQKPITLQIIEVTL